MNALTILIIRHAEKPDGDITGPGLTHKGLGRVKTFCCGGAPR
ncbi:MULTISPECIES: hypothetical protein [unclassified Bradyrhizobium]|nr:MULTISPECIES: hypothetical protein [unclassified Bradyrhizobium]